MEDSSCKEHCSFVKSGFCNSERECPFYVETWWKKQDEQSPKLVKDCFPKKFALEQNHLLHRFLCMQSSLEEMRNRFASLESLLTLLISQSQEVLKEETKKLEIRKTPPQQIEEDIK